MNHNKCRRCGKKLKTPESRTKGYGTICFKKSKTDKYRQMHFDEFMEEKKDDKNS